MNSVEIIDSVESSLARARGNRRGLKSLLRVAYSRIPVWAAPNNADGYFRAQERLLKEGSVRMASVVQAKPEQFKPGKIDDDGVIVQALGEHVDIGALESAAERLAALKGREFDHPGLKRISTALSPGSGWIIGEPVPDALDPPGGCLVSYTMISRLSLPEEYLAARTFPVLTLPDEPGLAMIVPFEHWPAELYEMWGHKPKGPSGSGTLGMGGLFGIMIIALFYMGSGMYLGSCVRWLFAGKLAEEFQKGGGSAWFLVALNVVGVVCLWAIARKVKSLPQLDGDDMSNRPLHKKLTSLPVNDRVAFFVWAGVYFASIIAGLILA